MILLDTSGLLAALDGSEPRHGAAAHALAAAGTPRLLSPFVLAEVDYLVRTKVGPEAQRASQLGFLHLLAGGQAYQRVAPTLWDVDFQTAIAQAELEDREVGSAYHRIRFGGTRSEVGMKHQRADGENCSNSGSDRDAG